MPVAPRCNLQCNYCNRKFDCVNESRPGVSSGVLTPAQALAYLEEVAERVPHLAVVGIAGPGDPFANPYETLETLRLVRQRFPEMMLCVASNGLQVGPHVEELVRLNVTHVTLTINAVDPSIGALIYAWVRDGGRPLKGEEAALLLIERQLEALKRLTAAGVLVKVNSIVIPGINDRHLPEVAARVRELGATLMNAIPLCPIAGTRFAHMSEPSALVMARVRLQCGAFLPQMSHCARCRADAVGLLGKDQSAEFSETLKQYAQMPMILDTSRPYVAVATQEGMLVNLHLGEAREVLIYSREPSSGEYEIADVRNLPPPGGGDERWKSLASSLRDCRAILVSACGPRPRKILEGFGLAVIEMEGLIEEGLEALFNGEEVAPPLRRRFTGCGAGCSGDGNGCS
ncbi:MAG: radical SAM protein [Chthoniobacterales bacterium]|nr:radical SAM protein [Chthoniobacterales bacterium]